jgi:hypothetical protein
MDYSRNAQDLTLGKPGLPGQKLNKQKLFTLLKGSTKFAT